MTIVKELNNLSEKVVGKNPKATTDAQAVKYIADNYTGGGGEPYVLPIASADTLGGIKVGSNLSITEGGVLSAVGGSGGESIKVNDYELIEDGGYNYKVFTLDKHEPGWYVFNFASLSDQSPIFFRATEEYQYKTSPCSISGEFAIYIPKAYSEIENLGICANVYHCNQVNGQNLILQTGFNIIQKNTSMPSQYTPGVTYYKQYAQEAQVKISGDSFSIPYIDITDYWSEFTTDGNDKYTYNFSSANPDDVSAVETLFSAIQNGFSIGVLSWFIEDDGGVCQSRYVSQHQYEFTIHYFADVSVSTGVEHVYIHGCIVDNDVSHSYIEFVRYFEQPPTSN